MKVFAKYLRGDSYYSETVPLDTTRLLDIEIEIDGKTYRLTEHQGMLDVNVDGLLVVLPVVSNAVCLVTVPRWMKIG